MKTDQVLQIRNLSVTYSTLGEPVSAIRDVNLSLGYKESLGIIGESGCGKSTLSFAIMDYLASNGSSSGEILFQGENLLDKSPREMMKVRGNRIAMVYQNPYASLNPSLTIGFQLDEVTKFHRGYPAAKARKATVNTLTDLYIGDPEGVARRYPHQISGGMQQRICIAMALLCRPDLIILDEPTTALDVTTEVVILDIIAELKEKYDMSLIYISHDIGVINKVSDRIAVMYRGEVVETGNQLEIFRSPLHPYTRALINCMPRAGVVKEHVRLNTIPGYVARRSVAETGCPFVDRCEKKNAVCVDAYGMTERVPGHFSACARAYAEDVPDRPRGRVPSASRDANVSVRQLPPAAGSPAPYGDRGGAAGATADSPAAAGSPAPYGDRGGAAGAVLAAEREQQPGTLRIADLKKQYFGHGKKVRAIDGVSVTLERGSVLGVVGESGCGKSTMGLTISGLLSPSSGTLLFDGIDISMSWRHRSPEVLRDIQLIFQNPGRSLNPSFTLEQIIGRPMKKLLRISSREERRKRIVDVLKKVDLGEEYLYRKATQLSGGEMQRAAVARAFSISPHLLVCDEPTSALDVSVQASVLNLLSDLQAESGSSYIFISHDLHVINYISDYIMVMYLGRICEYGRKSEVVGPPFHPYTEALLSAVPEVDASIVKEPVRLSGSPPNPTVKIRGCPFAGRCHRKIGEVCDTVPPPKVVFSEDHYIYCHIPETELANRQPIEKKSASRLLEDDLQPRQREKRPKPPKARS